MKRARQMANPRAGEAFTSEDAREDIRIGVRKLAKGIRANPAGDVDG
jgi:hypothetical protein